MWFEATRPGRYHLFCAEYCGTKHSAMIGWVVVMEPAAFQAWLAGGGRRPRWPRRGEKLFQDLGCVTCHRAGLAGPAGPRLEGLFGSRCALAGGDDGRRGRGRTSGSRS